MSTPTDDKTGLGCGCLVGLLLLVVEIAFYAVAFGLAVWVMGLCGCLPERAGK